MLRKGCFVLSCLCSFFLYCPLYCLALFLCLVLSCPNDINYYECYLLESSMAFLVLCCLVILHRVVSYCVLYSILMCCGVRLYLALPAFSCDGIVFSCRRSYISPLTFIFPPDLFPSCVGLHSILKAWASTHFPSLRSTRLYISPWPRREGKARQKIR